MGDDAGSSAQRIRIGLTGLAFAFLLVLLGSVISRSRDDDGEMNEAQAVAANEAKPDEPLARLGVAPGTSPEDEADAAAEAAANNTFIGPRE
jgi:hypothetical protein